MLRWLKDNWVALKRPDTRPTRGQWIAMLIISSFAGALVFGISMWVSNGKLPHVKLSLLAFVILFGTAFTGFVGKNIRTSLRRSHGPAAIAQLITLVAAIAFALLLFGPRTVLLASFESPILMFVAMFLSGVIVAANTRNPDSDRPMCAKCAYPYIDPDTPERCPECGAFWQRAAALKLPKPTVARPARVIGAFVFFVFVAMMFLPIYGPGMSYLPTTIVRWIALSTSFRASSAFVELGKRTLSPDDTRELAQHLLTRSSTDILTSRDGMLWLESLALNGTLPADLRERYFAEMRIPVLRVSSPLAPGDPGAAAVAFIARAQIAPAADAFAIVHSITLHAPDGTAVPTNRELLLNTLVAPMTALWSSPFFSKPALPPPPDPRQAVYSTYPRAQFTAPPCGMYIVRAQIWIVVVPPGGMGGWVPPYVKPDGSLNPPPGMVWSKHFVLEEPLEVR